MHAAERTKPYPKKRTMPSPKHCSSYKRKISTGRKSKPFGVETKLKFVSHMMSVRLLTWATIALTLVSVAMQVFSVNGQGSRISQISDDYIWTPCSPFESTKKNCPRGEQCLKLKSYRKYAWNWAMRCEFITIFPSPTKIN